MRSVLLALAAWLVFFSACRTLGPEPGISLPFILPENFSIEHQGEGKRVDTWWHSFGSNELDILIHHALNQSFDLKTLRAKIAQASAKVTKQEASFFPDLGFSFGGQKKGVQVTDSTSTYTGSHSWDGSLSASYSADVWGDVEEGETI